MKRATEQRERAWGSQVEREKECMTRVPRVCVCVLYSARMRMILAVNKGRREWKNGIF